MMCVKAGQMSNGMIRVLYHFSKIAKNAFKLQFTLNILTIENILENISHKTDKIKVSHIFKN